MLLLYKVRIEVTSALCAFSKLISLLHCCLFLCRFPKVAKTTNLLWKNTP